MVKIAGLKSLLLGGFWMVFVVSTLSACTNKLNDKALEDAKQLFMSDMAAQTQSALPANHELYGDYQAFVGKKVELEALETDETEASARVKVQITTPPLKTLVVLAEIAGKQFGSKASKFNMGNALQLIQQQEGMSSGKEQVSMVLLYKKSGNAYVFDRIEKPQNETNAEPAK